MAKECLPFNPYKDESGSWEKYELEDVYVYKHRGDFGKSWEYDRNAVKTMICRKCGGDHFMIGQSHGAYELVGKCSKCGWERSFYSG